MKADLNIIDLERLKIGHPYMDYALPTGAKIWMQDISGYDYTIISGEVTYKDNKPTGALPGRLIRNPKTAAVRAAGAVSELDLGDRQPLSSFFFLLSSRESFARRRGACAAWPRHPAADRPFGRGRDGRVGARSALP